MELLILLSLICLFLFIVLVFMSVQFYNVIFCGYAPFISSNPKVIARLMSELNLKNGGKVYELGCGKAGFLGAVSQKLPNADCVGIENSPWPYLRAKIQASMSQGNIRIINEDMFKVNLKDANLIYCYLNTGMMGKLEKKFKVECRPGTQLISNAFPLPNAKPTKVIEEKGIGKIYIYIL